MLDKELDSCISQVFQKALKERHEFITTEHLMLGLLENQHVQTVLTNIDCDMELLKTELQQHIDNFVPVLPENSEEKPIPTAGFQRVMQRAIYTAQSSEVSVVTGDRVLISFFDDNESYVVFLLAKQGIDRFDVVSFVSHSDLMSIDEQDGDEDFDRDGNSEKEKDQIEQYLVNLNEKALAGQIDPLIGRHKELERTIQILLRRSKNNPLLVGEPGVGKTAIAAGLAKRIVDKEIPELMQDAVVFSLDLGNLLAGTKYRGDFEKRMKKVIQHVKSIPHSILFIDEIHTIIGAGSVSGGTMDASNLLKPALSAGELRCIGATTAQEARTVFDKDRALSRRFQKVDIREPSVKETIEILTGLKSRFEDFHGVKYETSAIEEAVKLTSRHLSDKFLPDKAIDAIDEAGSWQRINNLQNTKIDKSDIRRVVASMAKIPLNDLSGDDIQRLQSLERNLKMVIFGQDEAIDTLTTAIKMSRAGMSKMDKPISNLLFAGPTGVGKTEVVKQLSHVLSLKLLRFDMSEYMEAHSVSRLIGSPPGYVGHEDGGLLTDKVHQNPYSIVLLDEIEKAHPDIFNVLLQVMDRGTLTDSNGRETDFRNVLLIMTTNAGAAEQSRESMGFTEQDHSTDSTAAIKRLFSPEFRNRLDATIHFKKLTEEHVLKIVDKIIIELEAQMSDKDIHFKLSEQAKKWLVAKGYDKAMGARPMHRAVENYIKKPVIDEILFGKLSKGGMVLVDVINNQLGFSIKSNTQLLPNKTATEKSKEE
ncbi:MAG TPA: ATP-dependent Clp protease ATP-binding subunit ClpA [Gammaproteobacteria bacterium]|nr:ATP-dependent Clp protease ATP-binding subunit ClpA [Xanthomonadales bacterium]HPI95190.1 ATP-dependent Clp protease ATP-binding subunit ClpA [Gammaproteobacteria bacterium]